MPPKAQPAQRAAAGPWGGAGGVDSFANSSYAASANTGHQTVSRQICLMADQLLTRTVPGQAAALVPALQNSLGGNQAAWQNLDVNNYKIWFILDRPVADKIIKLLSRSPVRIILIFLSLF
jgi:hypothetical protein